MQEHKHRFLLYLLPLLLLVVYGISIVAIVGTTTAETMLLEAYAKVRKAKSCSDYGSAALRRACEGTGGKAPTTCPSGKVSCGATNSCETSEDCVKKGAILTPTKKIKDDELTPTKQELPEAATTPLTTPRTTVATTPSPGTTPAVTSVPRPPISQSTPTSYYSQVESAWADQMIPGQNKKFAEAGCGEVTVANILTHAGIPTDPNKAASYIKKDQKGSGTAYSDNIAALKQQGFRADQYYGSFKDLPKYMGPKDVVWLTVIANNKTYKNMGHHTYIDGYTVVNGKPVYNLRDPFFGDDMKCGADGDRGLACSGSGQTVNLSANADSDNSGTGTVAVIVSPPGI